MAVPEEGTQSLPKDAGSQPFVGLWDATGSKFYAMRVDNAAAINLRVAQFNADGKPIEIGKGPVTLDTQTTVSSSGSGSTISDLLGFGDIAIELNVTVAPSGGSPTLDLDVMTTIGGTQWFSIGRFAQTLGVAPKTRIMRISGRVQSGTAEETQAATLPASEVRNGPWGDKIRIHRVIGMGGATGGYTYTVKAIFK